MECNQDDSLFSHVDNRIKEIQGKGDLRITKLLFSPEFYRIYLNLLRAQPNKAYVLVARHHNNIPIEVVPSIMDIRFVTIFQSRLNGNKNRVKKQ